MIGSPLFFRPSILFCAVAIALLTHGQAVAHTPTRFLEIADAGLAKTGRVGPATFELRLRSLMKEDIQVLVVAAERDVPKLLTKVGENQRSALIALKPGARTQTRAEITITEAPKQIATVTLVIADKNNVVIGHQPYPLYFKVDGGQYTRATYEELYVPRAGQRSQGPLGRLPVTATAKMPPDTRIVPAGGPQDRKFTTFNERSLKLKELPRKGGTGRQGTPNRGDLPLPANGSRAGAEHGGDEPPIQRQRGGWLDLLSPIAPAYAQATYTVSGRFSYIGLDNNWHAAWNWFVVLWWQRPNGSWARLANRYINPDGTWSVSFAMSGYSGQNLLIQYRAGGYYILPQDRNNNEYWWQNDMQSSIPTNFNIGDWAADTSAAGTLAGLGDVYNSAIIFWNAFYVNGLNPERSSAIRLFFPNTWDNCGGSAPWSCASVGGDIWLIAAHTDPFVIQHELGHQLNNQYWNNARPPGAGGSHTLTGCFNTGLALREGFADFAPFWVMQGATAADPSVTGGFEVETPDASVICNGDTNEVWVAGTFWDLLDTHSDGQDNLWFNNPVEVFSIYLGAGVKNGIKNYRANYRSAASPGHQTLIDNIYTNNTITVP